MSEVILVLRNGKVTGHVTDAGKHFKIGATKSGQHTLAAFSVTTTIPDHPRFTRQLSTLTTAANTTVTTSLQPTKRLICPYEVNTGNEVAEFDQETYASQNKASLAALPGGPSLTYFGQLHAGSCKRLARHSCRNRIFVAQTNRAYADSRANVRVTLAYAAPISFTESASIENDLTRYANMSEVLSQRNLYAADIGVLLSNAGTTACGSASSTHLNRRRMSMWNFANDCAGQNYSFTRHEIAHILVRTTIFHMTLHQSLSHVNTHMDTPSTSPIYRMDTLAQASWPMQMMTKQKEHVLDTSLVRISY